MLEETNARGLLEIGKALGHLEIVPGLKLFTREYFKKGRIVYLDKDHPAEVMNDNIFPTPFIFTLSDSEGGNPIIYECVHENVALCAIDAAVSEFKNAMEAKNITGGDDE